MKKEIIAKSKSEWMSLIKKDLAEWNKKNHEDDRMSINDWIGEVGDCYGWILSIDRYGDYEVNPINNNN